MASYFPDPRRIVTGHDEQGNAIVLKDSQVPCVPISSDANFAVLWETYQFPADLNNNDDPIETRTTNLANDKGVVLRIVDIPPNTVTVGLSLPLSRHAIHIASRCSIAQSL